MAVPLISYSSLWPYIRTVNSNQQRQQGRTETVLRTCRLAFPKTPLNGVIFGGPRRVASASSELCWLLLPLEALPSPLLEQADGVVTSSHGESSEKRVSWPLSTRAILITSSQGSVKQWKAYKSAECTERIKDGFPEKETPQLPVLAHNMHIL